MCSDISIIRGDTEKIQVSFLEDGLPFSILGMTVSFTVKDEQYINDVNNDRAIIAKVINDPRPTGSDPINGIFILELSSIDTNIACKRYLYDMQLANGTEVKSTRKGFFDIVSDVTR